MSMAAAQEKKDIRPMTASVKRPSTLAELEPYHVFNRETVGARRPPGLTNISRERRRA